jgi:hypothetical protein
VKVRYMFSVLRYVHDGLTGEFVNVGVALYAPDTRFLKCLCTTQYSRITKVFDRIDGDRFRQLIRFIQEGVNSVGGRVGNGLAFEPIESQTLARLLERVLPADDSSVQFSPAGVGLTDNEESTLGELFQRYVARYASPSDVASRGDEEVWRTYRDALDKRNISQYLTPKRIIAPDYEYEFRRAWENEIWHLFEPVSMDLIDAGSMLDKANRWVGRASSLRDSSDRFKIHLLLGEPQDRRLLPAFTKAENILRRMPVEFELVEEKHASEFAAELEQEIGVHEKTHL